MRERRIDVDDKEEPMQSIPLSEPDIISISEAARRIGIHTDTLYRLARQGQFPPAIKIGRRWRVSVPRLQRFLHGDDWTA
jgi:excisionase family DNA binding protein